MAVLDFARRSLMARESVVGPRVEVEVDLEVTTVRKYSSSLVVKWLASAEVLVKGRCRVRGLTSPSGDGWGGTIFEESTAGGKAKRRRVGEVVWRA